MKQSGAGGAHHTRAMGVGVAPKILHLCEIDEIAGRLPAGPGVTGRAPGRRRKQYAGIDRLSQRA